MNRRSFLSAPIQTKLSGGDPTKNKYANKSIPAFAKSFSSLGLDPYTGPWGDLQIKHLMNRAMFGFTSAQFQTAKGLTMNQLLDLVLTPVAAPNPPLYNYYNEAVDTTCAPGTTWVNSPHDTPLNNLRTLSLKDWWLSQMLKQGISIQEKMCLMLQNLAPIQYSAVPFARYCYNYNALVRTFSLGNYKDFVRQLSKDKAMLVYLNGYKNQKNSPDENFARELQELFTVGKGPDSKYTESDVKEAARVLTGYSIDLVNHNYIFIPQSHDTGNKQFSSFYNNAVITGKTGAAGETELDDLLDMIFVQSEVAKHVVRSIYRWFVYYVIDEEIETNIIQPLADIFRNNNYELLPVLEVLFKSEHFYDSYNSGCVIKNPIEYNLALFKSYQVPQPSGDVAAEYYGYRAINIFNLLLAMDPGDPPNVAGWDAYRTSPIYHEAWINSVTISYRNQLFEVLLAPLGYRYKGVVLKIDYLTFTETIPNAADPNDLIDNLINQTISNDLTLSQKASLKTILLSNQLEDHYWTDAWNNYLANKANPVNRNIVDVRLYGFYRYFLSLAENQLI